MSNPSPLAMECPDSPLLSEDMASNVRTGSYVGVVPSCFVTTPYLLNPCGYCRQVRCDGCSDTILFFCN